MHFKTIRYIIVTIIIILSYGFITYKIIHFEELESFNMVIIKGKNTNWFYLFLVSMLMILNWSIEAKKWQNLIVGIQQFSFSDSIKAVFSGVTVGIFTPNRVGEIGGRISFLEKGKRTYGVLATGIGSLAQFMATIIMGVFGFVGFLLFYTEKTKVISVFNVIYTILLLLLIIILFWCFYNIKQLMPVLKRIKFFNSRIEQLNALSSVSKKSLTIVLGLSILRYFVFLVQFYVLLYVFDAQISLMEGFVSISLTYLFMTIIPTTTLIELGIRGSLAIFFIGIFTENVLGILLASIFLWIINIALPALAGSFFLFKTFKLKTLTNQSS